MTSDQLFLGMLNDLEAMERITEAKVRAAVSRDAHALVALLQEQIDPMYRLASHTLELADLSDARRQELAAHISRWAAREQYLTEVLEKNLGYIEYLKQLLKITTVDHTSLNVGL